MANISNGDIGRTSRSVSTVFRSLDMACEIMRFLDPGEYLPAILCCRIMREAAHCIIGSSEIHSYAK